MKLLLDQDVYAVTVRFLKDLGHEIIPVAELGLAEADDEELLSVAQEQNCLFVTRDRDFGHLVFVRELATGVLYLRILPSTLNVVHDELANVLKIYSQQKLRQAFVVIEPGGHRIRRASDR